MQYFNSFSKTLLVSKEVVRLIWETSREYTLKIVLLLFVTSLVPIFEAYTLKKIIDSLSLGNSIDFAVILRYIIYFFMIILVSRLIENQRLSTQIILGSLFSKNIQQKIVDKTSSLEFWCFEDPKFYDKLERVRQEATWKPLNTFYHLFDSIQGLFTLVSVFVIIYALNPMFMLFMIFFSIPSLIVQVKYGNVWWNLLYSETPESRRLNYSQELMTSSNEIKDIKLLNLKPLLINKYKMLYNKLFNEQKNVIKKRYFYEFFTYLLSDAVFLTFYVYLARLTYLKQTTIGDFTFYGTTYTRGVTSLHNLVNDIAGVYENNLFITELLDFLRTKEEQEQNYSQRISKEITEGFEFKNVWFKYSGTDTWTLKGISFKLPLKKSIALVGENGAGKTTIVKLLTRLYKPTKGEILFNNVPIEKYNLNEYRKLFGITFQDFAKFYFTVKDNIKFGDLSREISDEEIIEISKKMNIHKKIMNLPLKYDNILGRRFNNGYELSQGEWQRLAITRALIRKAPIYILDEPTAALDAKAEYNVFRAFQKIVKKKTAIFISHRFSNVKLADEILVLGNGKIIEHGTHSELLKEQGRYYKLYNFQAKRYQD